MSNAPPRIRCNGRDGEKEFLYSCGPDAHGVWLVTVESDPRPPSNATFDMMLKEMPDGTLRQTMISAHNEPAYRGAGIPEAMLPLVKKLVRKEVFSSPPNDPDALRSPDGERMWKRLVSKGIAEYLPDREVYRVL